MKKILLALLATTATISFADEITPMYVNVNTGIAKLYNMPTGSWVGSANVGYNFNKAFALEAGYTNISGSQYGATSYTNILDVAAKGTLPLSNLFSLYGRAGIGYGNNSWSGTTNTPNCTLCNNSLDANYATALVGIGASFALTPHWDLRLEDTAYVPFTNTSTGTIDTVMFGTQFNF